MLNLVSETSTLSNHPGVKRRCSRHRRGLYSFTWMVGSRRPQIQINRVCPRFFCDLIFPWTPIIFTILNRLNMKKFFVWGILLALTSGFALASCSDDDDEPSSSKTCTCKRKDPYTGEIDGTMNAQPSSYGVNTCTELAQMMAELSDGYYYYSCN